MKSQSVILLLGGNVGQVIRTFASALALIEKETGSIRKISSVYKTQAWGPKSQDDFLNLALEIKTVLSPGLLLKKLLDIERRFGRKRLEKYGPRTLDIDILFYSSRIVRTQQLSIPHPEIQNRRFALIPCCEIIPRFKHPLLNKNMTELLEICTDNSSVEKL